ncbi:MAG: DHH family phosphoesterase [Oscillospiraceae bacterium]|nr:DHH family phosphoesterase [Oscillospiraceae bacterium]
MSKTINIPGACRLLREHDDVLILAHQKPDGDTLGSAFALMWALEALGKRARVECSDPLPENYRVITGEYAPIAFTPRFVVSVDIANPDLLGRLRESWEGKIDLCIDHHQRNTMDAAHSLIDPTVPATAELVYQIVTELGVSFDTRIAGAIFMGLATDTGCFRYASVTAGTHRIAAEMIEAGARHGEINRIMFDTRSRALIEMDKLILNTLEYHFGGLCAMVIITREATGRLGVVDHELDGVSALPRRIQGVEVGLALREIEGGWRVSVRTRESIDSSALCATFGGGGHKAAGGCTIHGDEQAVRKLLLPAVEDALRNAGLLPQ